MTWVINFAREDCFRVRRSVCSQRGFTASGDAAGIKFLKAHPMKSVEEFVQFSLARSGRDKAAPDPEPEPEPEQEREPEEGSRSRRIRKSGQYLGQSVS